ncbi:MAG: YveK family protein [Acutalibacteraceae bacterium]
MSNYDNKKTNRLNVKDIIALAFSKWYIFLSALAVCVIVSLVYSYMLVTPLYDSTGKLYITDKESQTINTSDLSVSSYLAKDYANLIVDRAVLDEIASELNRKYTYSQLKSAITVTNPEGTRFLEITARTPSANDSKEIVDSVCRVSQEKLVDLLGIDRVVIIREGNLSKNPSVPNVSGNALKGVLAAVFIYVSVICAIYFLNDKINGPEDVEKYLGISVLGNIPFNQSKAKSK